MVCVHHFITLYLKILVNQSRIAETLANVYQDNSAKKENDKWQVMEA